MVGSQCQLIFELVFQLIFLSWGGGSFLCLSPIKGGNFSIRLPPYSKTSFFFILGTFKASLMHFILGPC